MDQAVQVFSAILWLAVGVSHLAQPRVWADWFAWLGGRGPTGAFVEGFILLAYGAFVVAGHNLWSWPEVLLTIAGWTQVLKGLVRFVLPQWTSRLYLRMTPERAWEFQVGGVFALAIGGYCAWLAWLR